MIDSITVSITMSLKLINKIEELAKDNNSNFNDFIIKELNKIASNSGCAKNHVKNGNDIINKYRNMSYTKKEWDETTKDIFDDKFWDD